MGLRGPQPLSAEQLKLRGSHRAKGRAEQEKEVLVGPSVADIIDEIDITPPGDLTDDAKEFWTEHAEDLINAGLLTCRSFTGFAVLCEAWSDFRRAGAQIMKEGMTVKGSRGNPKKNPAIQIRDRALEQFTKLSRRFGITP